MNLKLSRPQVDLILKLLARHKRQTDLSSHKDGARFRVLVGLLEDYQVFWWGAKKK